MAEKKESAEQKLLKMIEASSGAGDASKTQKKVSKKQNLLSVLKTLNKVLVIVVIAAVLLLFNEVRSGMALMSQTINIKANKVSAKRGINADDLIPPVQRLSYYLASIRERNIFLPYEAKSNTNVVEVSGEADKIVKATKSLRLVGIAWLDTIESASAMIEDVEKETTHFLHKGEELGDIIVKTIYADSVELGYENEEIIIRYDKSHM